jgi:hypothetical protein
MTAKHLVHNLMRATRSSTHQQCSVKLGLPIGILSRMASGKQKGCQILVFDRIQRRSGIPADTLLAWYREGQS